MTMTHTIGPYRLFFDITAWHPFFADGICRQLQWVPASATWRAMENLGMLFRAIDGGVAVYVDTRQEQGLALMAAQADSDFTGFVFRAYATDPLFHLYTAYPETGDERVLCLDTNHTSKDPSGGTRLHPKTLVTAKEMVPLADLHAGGALTRRDRGVPPVLVVRIHLVGGDESPLDRDGRTREMRYRIHFDNRRTYWKYYVLGELASKDVSITDPDRKRAFEKTSADPVAGGRPAVAFISDMPIPLREVPDTRFQLKRRKGKREKVVIQRLPVAPVNRMQRDVRNLGDAMISEIFIHS